MCYSPLNGFIDSSISEANIFDDIECLSWETELEGL